MDGDPAGLQVRHGFRAVDDAASRRDDMGVDREREDVVFLDAAEIVGAVGADDFLQAIALAHLDVDIRVDESEPEALGQKHAHRALAHPGHADQDDVLGMSH